jgi:hypothetical protein
VVREDLGHGLRGFLRPSARRPYPLTPQTAKRSCRPDAVEQGPYVMIFLTGHEEFSEFPASHEAIKIGSIPGKLKIGFTRSSYFARS